MGGGGGEEAQWQMESRKMGVGVKQVRAGRDKGEESPPSLFLVAQMAESKVRAGNWGSRCLARE